MRPSVPHQTDKVVLSRPVSLTGVNSDTTIIHAMAGLRVLTVTGVTISNSVVVSGLTFTGGSADLGGGLLITDAARPVIYGLSFVDNQANDKGGGLYAQASLKLIDSKFVSNTATGDGGAAYSFYPGSFFNVYFEGNQSSANGGAVYSNDWLILSETTFIDNVSQFGGGGVSSLGPTYITDSRFERNRALNNDGGGMQIVNYGELMAVTLVSNMARFNGGGAVIHGPASIRNSDFHQNLAAFGGGLCIAQLDLRRKGVEIN